MSATDTIPAPVTESPADAGQPDWSSFKRVAYLATIGGFGAFLIFGVINLIAVGRHEGIRQFFLSYLVGYVYWFSLPAAGTSLLMLHYLAKSSWGLLLKRFLEASSRTLPIFAILFVPVAISALVGSNSPYWWTAPNENMIKPWMSEAQKAAVKHEIEFRQAGTYGFLSPAMFLVLSAVYLGTWYVFSFYLNKWSVEADNNPSQVEASLEKLKNISGPGLIIHAIILTAASTHWVMSLEPTWASTMFPVIFNINQFLTMLTFAVALFLTLSTREPLKSVLRPKFQIDMGSLMLAFTLFWSYTSFSQYMLIFIGNLPEEIPFYLKRSAGGWWYVSMLLCVLHFALPFLVLLFRSVKLDPKKLRRMAIYLMVVCLMDVWWWISPSIPHEGQFFFLLMDFAAVLGVGGVFGLAFVTQIQKRGLLPANETFMLPEGHDHGHH